MKAKEQRKNWSVMVVSSMKWLPSIVDRLAAKHGMTDGELFRYAFCEHYAKEDAELAAIWADWKRVMGKK